MQGRIQPKGFASGDPEVLQLKAEKASIFTFSPTFRSDLQALKNPLHYIITCKAKKRSGIEIRSVPKSMGGNKTSPVLTPHCAQDSTKGTAPFFANVLSNAPGKEAQIKCPAGLPLAMLALPKAPSPGRGSLRQAVTLGWHRECVHQLTWPEQHLNPQQWLRKGLRNATPFTPREGEVLLHPALKDSLQRTSRFTEHSPVSVL